MNNARLRLSAKFTLSLLAALPLAAQSPDTSLGFSLPPLHRLVQPASAASSPTGIFPHLMRQAIYVFPIQNHGNGQVIAIIDAYDDPTAEADLATFTSTFKQTPCTTANGCFRLVYQTGTKPPADRTGWSNEVAIDIQWAHTIAPLAKIMLVEANSNRFSDLLTAVDVAVANGANIVSMSWSGGESRSELQSDSHFNVPGVTFVAASGDGGHGAVYPAASPYVVGVGGTSLTIGPNGGWKNEVAWFGSGGGASAFEAEPAYQSAVQSTGKRGIPDVAYDGDPNTGVPAYNSNPCSGGCFTGWGQWGGTSIGTPQWAALFALVNSERVHAPTPKAPLGAPHVLLYAAPSDLFHDITSGKNGGCGSLCNAGPGYDFVTGIGSPQASYLIHNLIQAP